MTDSDRARQLRWVRSKVVAAALVAPLVALAIVWLAAPTALRDPLVAANRASAGLDARVTHVADHDVHYLERRPRERETIVLLHGIFAEKDHGVDFARALDDERRLLVPDLPGFGESTRRDDADYHYAAQVERLHAFLVDRGVGDVHLAGSSMGGTIAALYAIAHPERVRSVAFLGAPHGIRTPEPSDGDRMIEHGEIPLIARTPDEFAAMLDRLFARRPFLPSPIYVAARDRAIRDADSNVRLWREQLDDRYLLDERLPELRAPLLVAWGERDRVFDVSGAEAVHALRPDATIEILPGLGHLPMMEDPTATATRYHAFLATAR